MAVDWREVFPEPAPARRRIVTRGRALAATLVVAAALMAGGAAWLLMHDPLAEGSITRVPGGTAEWTTVETSLDNTVYYVSSGRPGTFQIGFDLANTGRLPVTIQGLASPSRFTVSGMARYPTFEEPDRLVAGEIVPFEPVSIEPGDARFFVLQIEFEGESVCMTPGGSGRPSDPRFRYRTLGIVPRTATVDVPFTVVTVCGDELPPSYSWLDGTR